MTTSCFAYNVIPSRTYVHKLMPLIVFRTILLMVLFSQYLRDVKVPLPIYKKGLGFSFVKANVFGLFPVGV